PAMAAMPPRMTRATARLDQRLGASAGADTGGAPLVTGLPSPARCGKVSPQRGQWTRPPGPAATGERMRALQYGQVRGSGSMGNRPWGHSERIRPAPPAL